MKCNDVMHAKDKICGQNLDYILTFHKEKS